jgi:hypothetical protein
MLRFYDMDPDGVIVVINWDNMRVGMSVFVPCVNTTKALKQLKNIFTLKQWQYEIRVLVESNMLGVRIWRTL